MTPCLYRTEHKGQDEEETEIVYLAARANHQSDKTVKDNWRANENILFRRHSRK
jgi:hypothetical protein